VGRGTWSHQNGFAGSFANDFHLAFEYVNLGLMPLIHDHLKLSAANGNDRAGSAEFERRRPARAFVDDSAYASEQQLEIAPFGWGGLLHQQSRVGADQNLASVLEAQQQASPTRFEHCARREQLTARGSRGRLAGNFQMDLSLPFGDGGPGKGNGGRSRRGLLRLSGGQSKSRREKQEREHSNRSDGRAFHFITSLN
jgi:hypothetical protein